MNNEQILRAYSIKEVSKKINIPTGTIRQWEKDLHGLLTIPRTKQGARYYTDIEINLLIKIKEMRGKNVSKDMIRDLLEKHLNQGSESPSETFATVSEPTSETSIVPVEDPIHDLQPSNIEAFHIAMNEYKQALMSEIRSEMIQSRNVMIDEIKNELLNTSLQTVNEVSKSIQRSNDKRKAEVLEISNTIDQASKSTSETFVTLSETIAKHSEGTFERLRNEISEAASITSAENKAVLSEVFESVNETKREMDTITRSIQEEQQAILESIIEIKHSSAEILKRELAFQDMLGSFREAASAKTKKKKWWQIWA